MGRRLNTLNWGLILNHHIAIVLVSFDGWLEEALIMNHTAEVLFLIFNCLDLILVFVLEPCANNHYLNQLNSF